MTHYYRQRRSIFGGLILILIGVIFLLYEYHPEMEIGRLFEHYWPLLLILWGIARLFDHLFASRRGDAGPPGISGGEIALIVLLLLVVASIAGFDWARKNNPGIDFGMGDMFEHSYDWNSSLPVVPAKSNEVISISTTRGNISVHPGNDSQLHVAVHKSASASDQNEARRAADRVEVKVTPTSNGYEIQPQSSGNEGPDVRVDLDVALPAHATITAQTTHGDITIAQMTGPVTIHSKSGDLNIHDISGDVDADLAHGDARVNNIKGNVRLTGHGGEINLSGITGDATLEGDFYGPIRASNVSKTTRYTSSRTNLTLGHLSGQLEMDSGDLSISDVPGSVQLSTANKDVTLEGVTGRIDLTDKRGDIQVTFAHPPHDDVRIADESASIDITLPETSNFEISAVSHNGDIRNDFESAGLKSSNSGDTTVAQGTYGAHGPHITLSTTYGTISIHKSH
ncbi:MAG TPA: DUF4097 family beta strand repeat-containing protein [Candidatus Acidoferrales bacterium]|nr:DUF4097 family beta strand repeat-containing protein [Candidatus Acidoferrales bacterium]